MILAQSLEVVKAARPRNTFLVGMAHDAEHAEFQARIDKLVPGQGVRLAYDGLVLRFKQPTVATE